MGTGAEIGDKVEQIVVEVKADPKSWYTSKTIQANALALIGFATVGLTGWLDAATWAEISTVVMTALNIALRFITTEPVGK